MPDDFTKTVRIKRPSRVAPDERGRSVWVGKGETVELELVSTTALKRILGGTDGKAQVEIRELAKSGKQGVLARDTATGHFRILSEADLKAAAETDAPPRPRAGRPSRNETVVAPPLSEKSRLAASELSLVSTQILRRVVSKKDRGGGFDPYDKG